MERINEVNLLKDKKVAILGGGPGGLTLARLLQLKGAEVKVYERDFNKESRVQGAIVDLHFDSGLKVMSAAGLLDSFKEVYMRGADKLIRKQIFVSIIIMIATILPMKISDLKLTGEY